MANYQKPQVTVEQSISVAPISADREQPAFVFGPNYQLHRFGIEDNSETFLGNYEGKSVAGTPFPYPGVKTDVSAVDKSYNRLYGTNVVVKLADLAVPELPEKQADGASSSGVDIRTVNENGGYTKLFFANKKYVGKADLSDSIKRGIVVGDSLCVTYTIGEGDAQSVVTTVTKAEYLDENANPQLDDDSYPELNVPGTLIEIADPIAVDADVDSIEVDFCSVIDKAEFERKNVNYSESGLNKWEWNDDGDEIVTYNLLATVYDYGDTPVECVVLYSDLYLSYRELVTSFSDNIHSVQSVSGVESLLGAIDIDNPLAMGVYMASLNAATDDGLESPSVFFMAVPEDSVSGYSKVLGRATLTDRIYTLSPTTRDDEVIAMVESHVQKMSSKIEKMWRIGSVSKEVSEIVPVVYSLDNVNADEHLAIPVSPTEGIKCDAEDYNMIRICKSKSNPDGDPDARLRNLVVVGDIVRFAYYDDAWGKNAYDEYIVDRVINNNTVMVKPVSGVDNFSIDTKHLSKAQDNAYYIPSKVEIWHQRTTAQLAEAVAAASRGLASRRMLNVFPGEVESNGTKLTGEFVACAVAGKISACLPQQPMTNLPILGIDNVPIVYQTYTKDELDVIASGGTFIIAQDLPGDRVYIRHQITTAYADGNLNTSELSITKNLDSISYAFADIFKPYIGKFNITPDFVRGLNNVTTTLIDRLGSDMGSAYGPQLIIDGTEILWVRQNELYEDRVDICVRINLPYPCNFIDIVLSI